MAKMSRTVAEIRAQKHLAMYTPAVLNLLAQRNCNFARQTRVLLEQLHIGDERTATRDTGNGPEQKRC